MQDCFIERESTPALYIDSNGNRQYNTEKEAFFLKNTSGDVVSQGYLCMVSLGDDHYAVCDLISESNLCGYYDEYDIINGDFKTTAPKMKWGIIRLSRTKSGNIIPRAEVFVVPYIYDRISSNNSKTATVQFNGKYSYVDLDIERDSYGKQLVPCILEHAVPFDVDIEGFAECSIEEKVGYLPRDTKPCKMLDSSTLLSESQANALAKFFSDNENSFEAQSAVFSYFALTGVKIEDARKLKLEYTGK